MVAQKYLGRPLLIDGFKFDLRVYVLVSCCDPLRIYLFEDGLVRLASVPYVAPTKKNLSDRTVHLTNYSVNKSAEGYSKNTELSLAGEGSKRSISWFLAWLESQGHNSALLWSRVADLTIKLLIAAQPHLARTLRSATAVGGQTGESHTRHTCFEILGLDVMFDDKLKPWLIEVNTSPSLTCDAPIDHDIKYALIGETMAMLGLRGGDRGRHGKMQSAATRSRLYAAPPKRGSPAAAALAANLARRDSRDTSGE